MSPGKINIYIIYHKNVYIKNTSSFTNEEIADNFIWVGVNESISKFNDDWINGDCLLQEWTMPVYNPLLQMSNFYQNSVFFHLYWNRSLLKSKYVGFAQYDMEFDSVALRHIFDDVETDSGDKVFGAYPYNFDIIFDILNLASWEECFMKPYNKYYNTEHVLTDISGIKLFLYHTFIIPKWFFIHMMDFVEKMYIGVLRKLNWNTRHLAGTLERVFALCIAFGIKENKFRQVYIWQGVKHNETQRTADTLRGIIAGSDSLV